MIFKAFKGWRGGGDDPEVLLEKHCKSCKACVVAYAAADRPDSHAGDLLLPANAAVFSDFHGFSKIFQGHSISFGRQELLSMCRALDFAAARALWRRVLSFSALKML